MTMRDPEQVKIAWLCIGGLFSIWVFPGGGLGNLIGAVLIFKAMADFLRL